MDTGIVSFGHFELDCRARELRRNGRRTRLQEQPFQILRLLIERSGQVVTREELRAQLWPNNVFVDFDHGLNNAIARLREVLGDSAERPRYIETMPRLGYRFVFPVESGLTRPNTTAPTPVSLAPMPAAIVDPVAAPSNDVPTSASPRSGRSWLGLHRMYWVAGVLILAALAFVTVPQWLRSPDIRSLAVLPFENLSADASQEYFVDGVSDALMTDLAQLSTIRVVSRTSAMRYKGTKTPLKQIARELNVDAIVEGTITRAGQRVRINAQLIRVSDDRHLWANMYDGELTDTLNLQSELVGAVANAIKVKLSPEQAPRQRKIDPAALDAYLKGIYLLNQEKVESTRASLEYFRAAIQAMPDYAAPYAGLGHAYSSLGNNWGHQKSMSSSDAIVEGLPAARKAVELDPSDANNWIALYWMLDIARPKTPEIKKQMQQAIQRAMALNSGLSRKAYCYYLESLQFTPLGLEQFQRALDADPLNPVAYVSLAEAYIERSRYAEALSTMQRAFALNSEAFDTLYYLGVTYLLNGKFDEALKYLYQAGQLSPETPVVKLAIVYAEALAGRPEALPNLQAITPVLDALGYPDAVAMVYIAARQRREALEWMRRAVEQGKVQFFSSNWRYQHDDDWLQNNPDYQQLVQRIAQLPAESGN